MDRYRGHRFRDWSHLPSEIVEEIFFKLDCPLDVMRLSSTCSTWLAASKRIRAKWRPANPWLILSEDTQDNPKCLRTVYNPGNDKWCYLKLPETFGKNCWGSDLGWIVTYGLDLEINVFNPLTKSRLHLPSTNTMLSEVIIDGSCHSDCKYRQHWMREGHILKAVVLKIGGGKNSNNGGLLVAVIHAHKRFTGSYCTNVKSTYLSIARPGDTSWTLINIPEEIFIRDVLCWKDLLWFVDAKCSLWYVDLKKGGASFNAVELLLESHPLIKNRCTAYDPISYLVESPDHRLLLVHRFCDKRQAITTTITRKRNGKTIEEDDFCRVYDRQNFKRKSNLAMTEEFKILKLDLSGRKWEQVDFYSDLGETSMFLGKNTSILVNGLNVGTCNSKCIYFAGDHVVKSGHDTGMHYLNSKGQAVFKQLYHGGHDDSNFCNPFWFTPLLN